jgi:hypothetical protein
MVACGVRKSREISQRRVWFRETAKNHFSHDMNIQRCILFIFPNAGVRTVLVVRSCHLRMVHVHFVPAGT